jgi:hypothetical protein
MLKKIIGFQKGKPRWDLEKLYTQGRRCKILEKKNFHAFKCES